MKRDLLFLAGGVALFAVSVAALAPRWAGRPDSDAQLRQRLENLQARLHLATPPNVPESISLIPVRALQASLQTWVQDEGGQRAPTRPRIREDVLIAGGESPSWLGVEAREVTSENVKELKLPAERGVLVGSVASDSPAAKAGLKENDVITEVNGQRVEGALQFRRMIREIPAGRAAQLTTWRDGRAQTLTVTLGKAEEAHGTWMNEPGTFSFHMPDIAIPQFPHMGIYTFSGAPARLGIDAEDLSGQLGTYFGAPDGEGVLVRGVSSGSPAEKAGVKPGDVITSFNGDRIRSVGELRGKLTARREDKSIKLGILRNKSQITLNVELPLPAEHKVGTVVHRTTI